MSDLTREQVAEKALELLNNTIGRAVGGTYDGLQYTALRRFFVSDPRFKPLLPTFVRTCRDIEQFWQFIKFKFPTYRERRDYLRTEFEPLLQAVDPGQRSPADPEISELLAAFDPDDVHRVWSKALDRRQSDPEGAITAARTLLETVCKHVLDSLGERYDEGWDLPKLYKAVRDSLRLSPEAYNEKVFRQILGGCTSVVEGLGALRNDLSDAHGKGRGAPRPAPRHAELAVNLAGTMATFLAETLSARQKARRRTSCRQGPVCTERR